MEKYIEVVSLTKLLTRNNSEIISKIDYMVNDFSSFCIKYKNWCDEVKVGGCLTKDIPMLFIYFLSSCVNNVGEIISFFEPKDSVVNKIQSLVDNMEIDLECDNIEFYNDNIESVLYCISDELRKKGYYLINFEVKPFEYNLFVVSSFKVFDIKYLASRVDLNINTHFYY